MVAGPSASMRLDLVNTWQCKEAQETSAERAGEAVTAADAALAASAEPSWLPPKPNLDQDVAFFFDEVIWIFTLLWLA